MHPKAKAWEKEHGYSSDVPKAKDPPVPEGRPCDVCGEVVERGYAHKECLKKDLLDRLKKAGKVLPPGTDLDKIGGKDPKPPKYRN